MALTRGIDPDFEFDDWLAEKPPASLYHFYIKAAQFLKKEDARRSRKQDVAGLNSEGIQSNVAVKQTEKSSGKVQQTFKINKVSRRMMEVKERRDPRRGRPKAPMFDRYSRLLS